LSFNIREKFKNLKKLKELFGMQKNNSLLEVEHFQESGFSALDLRIQKIPEFS